MASNRKSEKQKSRKPVSSRARNRRLARRSSKSPLHGFEALEDRRMLATLTVGNSLDVIDGDTSSIANLIGSPGADGISLREAIRASNNTAGADTITFDPAVFTGGADSLIRLTEGGLAIGDSLSIDASAAVDVTITGDALGNDVVDASFITDISESLGTTGIGNSLLADNSQVIVFNQFGLAGDLALTGLTITGGVQNGFAFSYDGGGGIRFDASGQLALTDTTVSGNFSDNHGGGIYSRFGNVSLSGSAVSGNTATGSPFIFPTGGGGIFSREGSLSLTGSTVSDNETVGDRAPGGGISAFNSPVTLTDSFVSGNRTLGDDAGGAGIYTNGGALELISTTVSGNLTLGENSGGGGIQTAYSYVTLNNSTVSGNRTVGEFSNGGGIHALDGSVTLTVSMISGNSTSGEYAEGGGISVFDGNVSLTNSTVSGNRTAGRQSDGGGIYARGGNVALTNSQVSDNHTTGVAASGGGIEANEVILANSTVNGNSTSGYGSGGGGIFARGDVTVTDSTISGNSTAGEFSDGGGIFPVLDLTLINSTVSGNSTTGDRSNGGGISVHRNFLTISNSTISDNSTTGVLSAGGGIFSDGPDEVAITDSTISGNSTAGLNSNGGGIYSDSAVGDYGPAHDFTLNNSTVSGNSTTGSFSNGGGIRTRGVNLTLNNSTVSGNSTAGENADGGGVFASSRTRITVPIDVTLNSSTITGNSTTGAGAEAGGIGILGAGRNDLTIMNSIVADNTDDGTAPDFQVLRDFDVSVSFSLIGDNTGTGLAEAQTADASGNLIGSGAAPIAPILAPLADNGGATFTHALLLASPAIDAGNSADTFDQRGFARVNEQPFVENVTSGNGSDIGAVEFEGLVLFVTTADDELDAMDTDVNTLDANDLSLREAIAVSNGTTGADTITFDPAVFTGGADSLIRLTDGDLRITDSLIIDASTAIGVTITGDANGDDITDAAFVTDVGASRGVSGFSSDLLDDNSQVFTVDSFSPSIDLTLTGLSLTGGVDSGFGFDEVGGAIHFDSPGQLSLTDTIVSGNFSANQGGGIFARFGDVTLINSEVTGNVTSGEGGGIAVYSGSLNLDGSTISDNYTTGDTSDGGGIYARTSTVTLTDSAVTGNHTNGRDSGGGGIYALNSPLTLSNSTVSGNYTTGYDSLGGGIRSNSATLLLTDSTVIGNFTLGEDSPGGGISAGTTYGSTSYTVTLLNSTVSENSTLGGGSNGGGIHSFLPLTLTDSVVSNNSTEGETGFSFSFYDASASGGGIWASGSVALTNTRVGGNSTSGSNASGGGLRASSVTLTNSRVYGNSTAGELAPGGGISAGSLTSVDSTVSGNSTAGETASGGGIFLFNEGTLTNSTISGNSTSGVFANGGGISLEGNFGNRDSSLTLTNSTVSGNSTTGVAASGAAITTLGSDRFFPVALTLTNSTITDNSSASNGAAVVVLNGSSTIENTILAGNVQSQTPDTLGTLTDFLQGPYSSLTISNSLIGVADGIAQPITNNFGNLFGTAANPLDPRLGPLADNGGPTQTHALLLGSPAFDAGSNALALDENGNPLLNDQRGDGFDRVLATSIDIGAFELDPSDFPDAPVVLSTVRDEGGVLDRPDLLTTYAVTFDTNVNVEAEDLIVLNDSLNRVSVDLSAVTFTYDSSIQTATWDFSSLQLDPAFYLFELSDEIALADGNVPLDGNGDGVLGGNFIESFYVALPGDANLDGQVNVLDDAFALVANLGTTGGATWAQGDFNGDGTVNVLGDAFILVSQLGQFSTRQLIVDNSLDVVNGDTSSVPNLLSSPGADGISLREAIIASNNTPVADFINFDLSVFSGGADSLIRLTGGELEISDTLNIDGSTAFEVTITGDANGDDITDAAFITDVAASFGGVAGAEDDLLDDNSRVLNFTDATSDLMLTGLTITGGRTTGDNQIIFPQNIVETTHSGGGIRFLSSGQLVLNDSTINGNSTAGTRAAGGAIYTDSGSITLAGSSVDGNSTAGNNAGGGGIATYLGAVTLTDSTASGNSTAGFGSGGGGIRTSSGDVTLTNSRVDRNSTAGLNSDGGGISTRSGDVTLTNSSGNLNSTASSGSEGGGISAYSGAVTLTNSTVRGNSTNGFESEGGGIATLSGEATLTNSNVSENSTSGDNSDGGGIAAASLISTNSTVSENFTSGSSANGGGISATVLTLTDSTVSENFTSGSSANGGGIAFGFNLYFGTGSLTLTNSSISGNFTSGDNAEGGGIYTYSASATLTDSTVDGNSTAGRDAEGGGIFTYRGLLTLSNSTVSENSTAGIASSGGGIFTGGLATLTRSTVSGNSTTGFGTEGGGIFSEGNSSLTLVSSTITGNSSAASGGGVFAATSSFTIENSIIADNLQGSTAGVPNDFVSESNMLTISDSLIGVVDNVTQPINGNAGNQFGTVANPLDPLLGPLSDNGGPTLTHAPLPNSPAIDAGNSAEAFDQRGLARLVDQPFVENFGSSNGSDIGAVEFEGVILVVTTSEDELDNEDTDLSTLDANDLSLREAIAITNGRFGSHGITFDPTVFTGESNSLIRLTNGELEITETLTIDASTATDVTITGDANNDDVTDAEFITDVAASFGGTAGTSDDLLDDNSRVLNFSSDTGDLTLTELTITGGRTTDSSTDGGGIRFVSDGLLTLASSTVSGNSTTGFVSEGGGIYTDSGALTLLNSTVSGNSTSGIAAEGGGIYVDDGDLTLINSTVSGNSTSSDNAEGGGIFVDDGDLTLISSTVSGNSTSGDNTEGGGIFVDDGDLTLINSTVSGNSTSGSSAEGGGIYVDAGSVALINSTVSGNTSAGEGGGVFVDGGFSNPSFTIENSILAGNLQNQTADTNGTPNDLVLEDAGSLLTINHSLIGVADNVTQPITGNVGNQFGTAANPLDPLLGPLANNGGPTQTHALLLGSPAFDAGNNALAVDENGAPLTNDQRGAGFDRILASSVDIGAFEFDPSGLPDAPVVLNTVRDEGGVLDRPDLLTTFSVTFDADVNVDANDLIIVNESLGGLTVDLSAVSFNYDSTSQTATWAFSSLVLDAAFYSFELSDDIVSADGSVPLDGNDDGFLGGNFIESVYVALPGDANLDGQVNVLGDAFSLVGNLGTSSEATWVQGDFNGDGIVNVLGDAFILVGQLGQSVIPPAPATQLSLAGSLNIDAAFEDDNLLGNGLFG